jgi:hypothetical protein
MSTDINAQACRASNGAITSGAIGRLTTASQCSADASEELLAAERLSDVIIGTSV